MSSRKDQHPDVVVRLFDEDWQVWELAGSPRRLGPGVTTNGSRRTLAVPARHVVASPLWIEGADLALAPEAAKLELEVRGLLSRAQGMDGISLRLLPVENRMLAVAAVFPPELPEDCPTADRFEGSPFLLPLPADAVTLWRENGDYVAAATRGTDVVYWETIDNAAGTEELRIWLSLIVLRLQGDGVLTGSPRIVSWIEGLPADRIAPAGCPHDDMAADSAGTPTLEKVQADWKPVSVHAAEDRRQRRARVQRIVLAVAAVYIVLAAVLGLYAGVLRWKAAGLRAESAKLRAEVESFQPTIRQWDVIAPTVESAQYPLELLRGVVEAMPGAGVQLTEFKIEAGKVYVKGEADSFALANTFFNNLASHEALRGIVWAPHQPTPDALNRWRFTKEGTLPPL
jgi:hypothetical protein